MNWDNLKERRCPNCGERLLFSYKGMMYYCPNNKPDKPCFKIHVGKMKKIAPKVETLKLL